jgi:hypothetical protein
MGKYVEEVNSTYPSLAVSFPCINFFILTTNLLVLCQTLQLTEFITIV